MRELTLNGFLKKYLVDLSGKKSENLSNLAYEADHNNPRLKEPLVLYAYFCKEPTTVKRQFANSSLYEEFCLFLKKFPKKEDAINYLSQTSQIDNYRKVYKSFISKRDRHKQEDALKKALQEEVLSVLNNKKISAYKLLKEECLNLNKGNFYAFLRGNTSCITVSSAYNVVKYLNQL